MAVPDFQSLALPVLKEFADGVEHSTKEIRQRVADRLGLSLANLSEVLPSGRQNKFSREALDYAKSLQFTIVLVDGTQVAELMIEFGVGVEGKESIKLRRLDEGYLKRSRRCACLKRIEK
jgi:restriction endonuclease Mrr